MSLTVSVFPVPAGLQKVNKAAFNGRKLESFEYKPAKMERKTIRIQKKLK
jgi:hypothetical protein